MGGGLILAGAGSVSSLKGGDYIVFHSMGYVGRKPEGFTHIVSTTPEEIPAGSYSGYPERNIEIMKIVDPLTQSPAGLRRNIVRLDISGVLNPGTKTNVRWNYSMKEFLAAIGVGQ